MPRFRVHALQPRRTARHSRRRGDSWLWRRLFPPRLVR